MAINKSKMQESKRQVKVKISYNVFGWLIVWGFTIYTIVAYLVCTKQLFCLKISTHVPNPLPYVHRVLSYLVSSL